MNNKMKLKQGIKAILLTDSFTKFLLKRQQMEKMCY
jgi:hypothetical protein